MISFREVIGEGFATEKQVNSDNISYILSPTLMKKNLKSQKKNQIEKVKTESWFQTMTWC